MMQHWGYWQRMIYYLLHAPLKSASPSWPLILFQYSISSMFIYFIFYIIINCISSFVYCIFYLYHHFTYLFGYILDYSLFIIYLFFNLLRLIGNIYNISLYLFLLHNSILFIDFLFIILFQFISPISIQCLPAPQTNHPHCPIPKCHLQPPSTSNYPHYIWSSPRHYP